MINNKNRRIFSLIHHGSDIDLIKFRYFQVYAGVGGGTITLNGINITLNEGSKFDIEVRHVNDIIGDVYFLGYRNYINMDNSVNISSDYIILSDGSIMMSDDESLFIYVE